MTKKLIKCDLVCIAYRNLKKKKIAEDYRLFAENYYILCAFSEYVKSDIDREK